MNLIEKIEYIISIDLHGTLLDKDENLSKGSAEKLTLLLKTKPENVKTFICTGNDLSFIKRKLGNDVFNLFDGAVLETGVVISLDKKNEEILVNNSVVKQIKELQEKLIKDDFKEIYKFANRIASISMFTNFEESVFNFYDKIKDNPSIDSDQFRVTYSNVAVDILPKGFNKFTGIKEIEKRISEKSKVKVNSKIIAIADSVNDYELLKNADISFLPKNGNLDVIQDLEIEGKRRIDFDMLNNFLESDNFFSVSNSNTTFGVIEILDKIFNDIKITHNL